MLEASGFALASCVGPAAGPGCALLAALGINKEPFDHVRELLGSGAQFALWRNAAASGRRASCRPRRTPRLSTPSPDEQQPYDLAFRTMRPRQFPSLVLIGESRVARTGDQVLTEREPVPAVCVAISGEIEVRRQGASLAAVTLAPTVG